MEAFWKSLRMVSLPWPTRAAAAFLLVLALVVDVGLFGYAAVLHLRGELVAASLQLFGTLLPLLLVVVVIAGADTGVQALARRTEGFFLRVLPDVLARLVEQPGAFYVPPNAAPVAPAGTTRVWMDFARGQCAAQVILAAPAGPGSWRWLVIRLELNVRRLNFNLCLPQGAATADLHSAFRHTLGGARAEHADGDAEGPGQSGYSFLPDPLTRRIGERTFTCLVGSKFVGRDFLWDAAEQLYLAQDLLFMLRAFLAEAPELFPTTSGDAPPDADALAAFLR